MRVGGCFGRGESVGSMWAQIKSLVHVSAVVIVSVLYFLWLCLEVTLHKLLVDGLFYSLLLLSTSADLKKDH